MNVERDEGAAPDRPIRVVVVDDHEVVRQGVVAMLGAQPDMVVCGQAGNTAEAVSVAETTGPDVVVMDVRLGGESGIEATREVRSRCPGCAVIMLTSFADEDALLASIMAGASGYVLKQIRGSDLVSAVRRVAGGESLVDPTMTAKLFKRIRSDARLLKDDKLASLSPREERILNLVAQGKTNREIADEIFISEKTVKNHISQVLNKLQVSRRAEAAAYLSRHSLLHDDG